MPPPALTSPSQPLSSQNAAPVVQIEGLTKSYGTHRAVDGLSFVVHPGEIFGVLGSNGAGKTTSVECAQGIRRPDSGSVRVLGCDPIADSHQLRGRVGSQLQDSNLPDRLKVREALELFADSGEQASAAMRDWELAELASSAFGDLSGGQRQRLFLALALLNDPEVVFLDELTQGLDPTARRSVWKLIERVRDQGTTVVLVTHFMEEAEVLCDRVVVVAHGRAVETGTPADLIERHSAGVRVRFAAEPDAAGWLSVVPGVRTVAAHGHEFEVTGPASMIAYLGAALVERGQVSETLRVDQPNLEDALIELITSASPQGATT